MPHRKTCIMKSRLQGQLAKLAAAQEVKDKQAEVAVQIRDSGDALELGARMALGAWGARAETKANLDLDDGVGGLEAYQAYELGYRTACGELSLILRAMRRGAPPHPADLADIEKTLCEELGITYGNLEA